MHCNAVAMPECAQLLQRFQYFGRGLGQRGKAAQERGAVAVDADVAQWCKAGQRSHVWMSGCSAAIPPGLSPMVSGMRQWCAAEIVRQAACVQHHLDHIGVGVIGQVEDGMCCLEKAKVRKREKK